MDTEFYLFLRKQIMNCMNLIIIWYPPKIAFCFSWCCWVFFFLLSAFTNVFLFSVSSCAFFAFMLILGKCVYGRSCTALLTGKSGSGRNCFCCWGKIGFWIFIFVKTTQEKTSNINSGILRFLTCRRSGKKEKGFFRRILIFFLIFLIKLFSPIRIMYCCGEISATLFFSHFPGNT